MEALSHLRSLIASLDETVVDALCARARLRRNEALYPPAGPPPQELEVLAGRFAGAHTPAGRVRILRPVFLQAFLPRLCEPGGDAGHPAPFSADAACLDALARRLSLSVHVATLKREAIPPALQAALHSRNRNLVEQAITFPAVEEEVLVRVNTRAATQANNPELADRIVSLYAEWIIPLSRKIQVHGLLDHA